MRTERILCPLCDEFHDFEVGTKVVIGSKLAILCCPKLEKTFTVVTE